jgi:hypothetical protein
MTARHRTSTEHLDLAALREAIAIVWRHSERSRELAEVMAERGWEAAAAVAAYDAQCRSLHLPPWEAPPCVAGTRGKGRASKLLRRMPDVEAWDLALASSLARGDRRRLAATFDRHR